MAEKSITESAIYKYKINELLIKQYGLYAHNARARLYTEMGITRATLSKDANILLSSRDEIPPLRLSYYQQFFKLDKKEDLINE